MHTKLEFLFLKLHDHKLHSSYSDESDAVMKRDKMGLTCSTSQGDTISENYVYDTMELIFS
jgi:hypothetical protein